MGGNLNEAAKAQQRLSQKAPFHVINLKLAKNDSVLLLLRQRLSDFIRRGNCEWKFVEKFSFFFPFGEAF
jgi:hypothetical protein